MWFFNNPQWRETNTLGFFSDFEYEDGFSGYIVVGDSQVEAWQVPFSKTFHQVLGEKINEKVYNIGLSGAPLSQYHAYVKEICRRYNPEKIIILIIANDFKESLKFHRIRDGWFHYDEEEALAPTPYRINWIRKLANESALAQYLYFNLRAGNIYNNIFRNYSPKDKTEQRSEQFLTDRDLKLDKKAINIFFKTFKDNCVLKRDIIFVLDANRGTSDNLGQNIYTNGAYKDNLNYFKIVAKNNDYPVIDLHQTFLDSYKINSKRFETQYDSHWTEHAHFLAAIEIYEYLKNSATE